MRILMKSIFGFLMLVALNVQSAEIIYEWVDDRSASPAGMGKSMHYCPDGFMVGLHVRKNDFLCRLPGMPSSIQPFDDRDTARWDMHACPYGTAMVGLHVSDNVLKCASIQNLGNMIYWREFLSLSPEGVTGQVRYGMHACPIGSYMVGVHVRGNAFLCGSFYGYF